MNVEDLRRFLVVARTSHITEASEILGLPQSTVSRSILRLEQEYGCPLFDRVGRRVRLNTQGETLREHAQRALDELEAAAQSLAGVRDPSRGVVRLGYLSSLSTWLIPRLLRDFRKSRPLVDFLLRQDSPEALAQAVRERGLHLAIVSPRPPDRVFAWQRLHIEQLCLTVPDSHPLAMRQEVQLEEVAHERFVLLRTATSIREVVEDLASRAGLSLDVTLRSDEITTVRALVVAGMGLTVTPVPIGHRRIFPEEGLVEVPLSDHGAAREVGIIWHRQVRLSAVAERFIDHASTQRA
jgi:DNA-binding transcriptional LysR family regulator